MLRLRHSAAVLAFVAVLGACRGDADSAIAVDVIGTAGAPFEGGLRLSVPGQLVRAATAEGLVALDEQGRVIPALADRWIVTDDGLSYIFRLREGTWPDSQELTGESVRQSLRQAIAGLRGTTLAIDVGAIDEVRAMAGRVVEIRLTHSVPDLLQLLAQPELGLLHDGTGGGPMVLQRQGPLALLIPIPARQLGLPVPDNSSGGLRPVALHSLPAATAIRRFREGEVDIVLGGRFTDYGTAVAVAGLSRRVLRIDPAQGLFGLALAGGDGPMADPALREALALAIDRDALAAALGVTGWAATTRLIPQDGALLGALGANPPGERWADLTPQQRRTLAAARTARWRAQHGGPPAVRLALPAGPGADTLYGRLAADLAAAGFAPSRVAEDAPAEARLIDNVARYGRPEWFLNQLSCAAARGACDPAADALVAEALGTGDPVQRAALLAQAEVRLLAANTFVPLGSPVRWSLVRDRVSGFAPNAAGLHPLAPLAARAQ